MKKFFFTIVLFSLVHFLFADIPAGYYDSATGSGYTLKTQLYNIIKTGHAAQSYGDLYDAYVIGDTDPEDGYVWDMYSENPYGADPYNYEHYTNNCGTYSNEGDCLNREHLFPQGIFNEASPMKTDYHHVVPSDGKVNGMRNNYPFGEVGSASWTSLNGSKLGSCNYPGYSGTVFEPIDEFKGDIARCMLYFATRYEDQVSSWSHTMLNGTSDQVYADWFISMLVEWHIQDPVDAKDNMRNEAGFDFQGNRNPFIDHPEYVTQIWGGGGNMIPSISNITLNPENPTSSDNVSISAEITDHDGTIESAELHWGISSGSLNNIIALINSSGDTYITSTSIPAQDDGTIIYFEIEATDDEPETKTTSEQSYKVEDNPSYTIFYEDFETVTVNQVVNINGWSQYYEAGTETWEGKEYSANKYAQMSAYQSGESSNITWLITPEIDLSTISEAILTFRSKDAYNNGDPVELFITTNYSGNPITTTWTKLNPIFATGTTSGYASNFTESGEIDITSYCGSTIYLGYKYTGGDPSRTTTIQIDDVLITGKSGSGNDLPVISTVEINPEIPTSNEDVTISATITDSDGTISSANIKWGTSTGSYPNTVTMSNSGDDYSGEIPLQSNGTIIYFIIDALDNEAGDKQSAEYNYTVNNLPVISAIEINPENPTSSENVAISATITDADGSISSADLKWGTNSGSYTNTISMTNSGDDYSGEIPMQAYGTKVYFIIDATDNKAENKQTSEYNYIVNDFPVISNVNSIPEIPISTEPVTVSATITDSDGSISSADLKWGTITGSYPNTVTMSNSGDDYSGEIPMQTNGTTVYFIIDALDNENGNKQTSEYDYTVNSLPVISNVEVNPENPTVSENVTISATISDADGSVSSADLKWGTSSGSYINTISMTASGDNYSVDIPAQSAVSTIYFLIEATDNLTEKTNYSGNYSVSESTGSLKFSSEKLRIYPNPAREILHIELSDNESVKTLKLFNIAGEKVYEITNVNSSKISVNLNNLIKGIYFIYIKNDNKTFIRKIVIE